MRNMVGIGVISVILITSISLIYIATSGEGEIKNSSNTEIRKIEEIGTSRSEGNIENSSRRLYNNLWGLTEDEKRTKVTKSYIYYKYNGSFGWEWDRPDPRNNGEYVTPIYPGVMVGASKFYSSTTEYLPIKLKDINSLTLEVEYIYTKTPTGAYNLAYDIWFVDNNGYNKAEVMVWIYGDIKDIPQRYTTDNINVYEYFYRSPTKEFNWDYHAFILKDQIQTSTLSHHKVNIKILLDMLIESGKLNTDWTMLGIELGNEIGRGSGRIEISKYVININGDDI